MIQCQVFRDDHLTKYIFFGVSLRTLNMTTSAVSAGLVGSYAEKMQIDVAWLARDVGWSFGHSRRPSEAVLAAAQVFHQFANGTMANSLDFFCRTLSENFATE